MNNPEIRASFELDATGNPEAISSGNLQHYRIKLHIDGAPEDTYAVTYLLDPSYRTPTREVLDRKTSFEESLTSYGDYTVQAKIRTPEGVTVIAIPLSAALRQTYGASASPAVQNALQLLASR